MNEKSFCIVLNKADLHEYEYKCFPFLGSENHTESHAPVVDGLEESICPVERSRNPFDVLFGSFLATKTYYAMIS